MKGTFVCLLAVTGLLGAFSVNPGLQYRVTENGLNWGESDIADFKSDVWHILEEHLITLHSRCASWLHPGGEIPDWKGPASCQC